MAALLTAHVNARQAAVPGCTRRSASLKMAGSRLT